MAGEHLRRLVHGFSVEGAEHAPGAIALERERAAAVDDAVEIMAGFGRKARIEIGATVSQAKTEIGSGRSTAFRASRTVSFDHSLARSKWAT